VYDVNDDKTFQMVAEVIKYLSEYSETKLNSSGFVSKKILIGNKIGIFYLNIYNRRLVP
jgi:hypothetical protein